MKHIILFIYMKQTNINNQVKYLLRVLGCSWCLLKADIIHIHYGQRQLMLNIKHYLHMLRKHRKMLKFLFDLSHLDM